MMVRLDVFLLVRAWHGRLQSLEFQRASVKTEDDAEDQESGH